MRDPLMPPLLMLVGAAFALWGAKGLRGSLVRPASEFRFNPRAAPRSKLEASIMRACKAFDGVSILLVGVIAFAIGLIDTFG